MSIRYVVLRLVSDLNGDGLWYVIIVGAVLASNTYSISYHFS